MTATITPCGGLSMEDRARRLSELMIYFAPAVRLRRSFIERARRPGFCTVCGARLPVTWRAVKCIEPASEAQPQGRFAVAEATHEDESLARLEEWKRLNPPDDQFGLRNGFWLQPVTACASLDERVWKAAEMLVIARARDVAMAALDQARPDTSRQEKARKAIIGRPEF